VQATFARALGHDEAGKAVDNWDLNALAGAGGIRSTANDMLRYLRANMGTDHSPLAAAMKLAQRPRSNVTTAMRIGLKQKIEHHVYESERLPYSTQITA
jgi:D-alanyl-D-alanine-carboxypeptidase/D-alanyl-D-alanine-endopeptidase